MPQFEVDNYGWYNIKCKCLDVDDIKITVINKLSGDVFTHNICTTDNITSIGKYKIIHNALNLVDGYTCIFNGTPDTLIANFLFISYIETITFSISMEKIKVAKIENSYTDVLSRAINKYERKAVDIITVLSAENNKLRERIKVLECNKPKIRVKPKSDGRLSLKERCRLIRKSASK